MSSSLRACAQWASPLTDVLQTYQTTKIVQLKDRRLGWLYYSLVFLIVLFVVGYEILYCNDHFEKRDVTGTPLPSIQQPTVGMCNPSKPECKSDFTPLLELPYCQAYGGNSTMVKPESRQKCIYADKHTLVPTTSSGSSILVPTRIDESTEVRRCTPSASNGYTCDNEYDKLNNTGVRYVADIERFTFLIAHSYQRDGISGNNNVLRGSYMECDYNDRRNSAVKWLTKVFFGAKECPGGYTRKYIPCIVGTCDSTSAAQEASLLQGGLGVFAGIGRTLQRKGRLQAAGLQPDAASAAESPDRAEAYAIPDGDVFTIRKLLALAGVNLDGTVNLDGESLREAGTVMDIQVHYNNLHPFRSTFGDTKVEYWYIVTIRPMHQVKEEVVAWTSGDSKRRIIQNRHGINIVVTVQGTFGFFSIMNLLLMLTTAAAMLTVATVLTDKIAIYLMAKRDVYSERKYETATTEDATEGEIPPAAPLPGQAV